jgi:hypothetical protein
MQELPHIQALDIAQVDQAFPLLRTRYPGLSLAQWRGFARSLMGSRRQQRATPPLDPTSGIVTARTPQGYLTGLFSYRVAVDLCHDRILEVATLVAAGLFDPVATVDLVLVEIERLATVLGCAAVRIERPQPAALAELVGRRLCSDCQVVESVSLCKEIKAAA